MYSGPSVRVMDMRLSIIYKTETFGGFLGLNVRTEDNYQTLRLTLQLQVQTCVLQLCFILILYLQYTKTKSKSRRGTQDSDLLLLLIFYVRHIEISIQTCYFSKNSFYFLNTSNLLTLLGSIVPQVETQHKPSPCKECALSLFFSRQHHFTNEPH